MKNKIRILLILLIVCLASSTTFGCTIVKKGDVIYNNSISYNLIQPSDKIYSSAVEMLDAVRPSVYEVYAQNEGEANMSCGSGSINYIIDREGGGRSYGILTCQHVIDGKKNFAVKDIYGNQFSVTLIGADPDSDIALLKLDPTSSANGWTASEQENTYTKNGKTIKLECFSVRDIDGVPLKVGERVYAIGNPLGTLGGTVTQGIISATSREVTYGEKTMNLIQTDCAINSGNSGGALIDEDGNYIGVVNAGYTGSVEGLNFAIPINFALKKSDALFNTWKEDPSSFGYIEGAAKISAEYGKSLTSNKDIAINDKIVSTGFWTNTYLAVISGTSKHYYESGLKGGDQIVSVKVGGRAAYNVSSVSSISPAAGLVNYLNSCSVNIGDVIVFNLIRDGQAVVVNVVVPQYVYRV